MSRFQRVPKVKYAGQVLRVDKGIHEFILSDIRNMVEYMMENCFTSFGIFMEHATSLLKPSSELWLKWSKWILHKSAFMFEIITKTAKSVNIWYFPCPINCRHFPVNLLANYLFLGRLYSIQGIYCNFLTFWKLKTGMEPREWYLYIP